MEAPPHITKIYFIRLRLNYGDIKYKQIYNASFHQKPESFQYNSALTITIAVRGTSKEQLHNKLGLETLKKEDGIAKCVAFLKIFRYQCPNYLLNIIPISVST